MADWEYRKAEDLPSGDAQPAGGGEIDPTPLLGTWYATDKTAGGVARVVLENVDGHFTAHAFGVASPEFLDWGKVPAIAYGSNVNAREAMSFTAVYDFGFLKTEMAAYGKQGILVLDTFNTFHDESGRAPYFTREFFHR